MAANIVAWIREQTLAAEKGSPRTVNIYLGFFLMVNLVLGTGFLSIPYGFFTTGIIGSVFTLMCISFISWVCAIWVLETMARSQAISDFKEGVSNVQQTGNTISRFYITPARKFEPAEMCQIFVGFWLKVVYVILLITITFFAAMAYSTVAGSAWAVNIPFHFGRLGQCHYDDFHTVFPHDEHCGASYRFCVFIFGCIVIFLSLLSLKEQLVIQVILGVLRFGTIAAIIIYCITLLFVKGDITDCDQSYDSYDGSGSNWTDTYNATTTLKEMTIKFSPKDWLVSISIYSYAHILHQAIPALTQPVREKKWLRGYFNTLFICLGVLYMIMGLTASLWFRDCISSTCTLNWEPLSKPGHQKALRALSYFIILFPSVDVMSAFPLVIHTTVNNIYTLVRGKDTTQDKSWKFFVAQLAMKFMAAVLPLSVAMFVANLVTVINYAGLIGFFICFYFPTLLQLASQWKCFWEFNNTGNDTLDSINCKKLFHSSIDKTEEVPLLKRPKEALWKRVIVFITSCNSSRYYTTYSLPFLSSPLFVLLVGLITSTFIVITIASLIIGQ